MIASNGADYLESVGPAAAHGHGAADEKKARLMELQIRGGHQVTLADNPCVPAGFDYGALPAEIRNEAKSAAHEIKNLMRHTIMEVGVALARIKERIPHGQWGEWLLAEFGLTQRTAQNYMAAAGLVAKNETVSVLQPNTLYQLASPSTPEAIRRTVIERFDAGEPMADRAIKEMIGQARLEQKEAKRRAEEVDPEARLFSKTCRARAKRRAGEEQQQGWDRERAVKEDATHQAADLLLSHLPPDAITRLRDLLRNCTRYTLCNVLLDRLNEASDPPALKAPTNNDQPDKIVVAAEDACENDPLITMQKHYAELSDRFGAYGWVMRRLSLGEMPRTEDESDVAAFVCGFIGVPVAIQKQFRASIGERPSERETGGGRAGDQAAAETRRAVPKTIEGIAMALTVDAA